MEEVAYFFDADFEIDLFLGRTPIYKNNKFNHVFEHLLFFIEDSYIYTKRNYSKEYLNWVEAKLNKPLYIGSQKSKILCPYMGERFDVELQKKWQNKIEVYKFLAQLDLLPSDSQFISKENELCENQLYKSPYSFSGLGHMLYPKDKSKIVKELKGVGSLIKEPKRDRVLDFSSLVTASSTVFYKTLIDQKFHFKGCIIDSEFQLADPYKNDYFHFIEILKNKIGDYLGVYSVDSYLYKENGEIKLFPACEVNMRKTMGYIAFKLKELFASEDNYFEFRIEPQSRAVYPREGSHYIRLSPDENLFQVYIWFGENRNNIRKSRELLFT